MRHRWKTFLVEDLNDVSRKRAIRRASGSPYSVPPKWLSQSKLSTLHGWS